MGCLNCGRCCSAVGFEISDSFAEFVEMHGIPLVVEGGIKKLVVEAPCKWRDEEAKTCTIHNNRPEFCSHICGDYLCEKARD
jgi:Fe-S-cluster containining protein